jgi:hypothetical protein
MSRRVRQAIAKPPLGAFNADRHVYTYGDVVYPSVTQVLAEERFYDFSHIPNGIRADALARGTYVHQVLHLYLEDDFDLADCDPRYRGYVDSAIRYLGDLRKKPLRDDTGKAIAIEYRFWHTRRRFAGTVDYVGWDADDVLSIDDFKTGDPIDVAAALQTAAYECGVRDCLLPTLDDAYTGLIRRRAVQLFADGKPGRAEPYRDPRDLMTFFAALTCVHYRRNNLRHQAQDYGTV